MYPIDYRKMESLQKAYVNAVVANAGKSCEEPTIDAGIDLRVSDLIQDPDNPNRYEDGGVVFNCQLKASTRCSFKDNNLLFPLKVRDYNKLVKWRGKGLCILVAFHMPPDPQTWISQTEETMCLRHCCYWIELTGQPPSNNKKPNSTQNISIPIDNMFTTKTVLHLTERARRNQNS